MRWPWERDPPPEPEGDPETTPGTDDDLLNDLERAYKRRAAFRRGDPK